MTEKKRKGKKGRQREAGRNKGNIRGRKVSTSINKGENGERNSGNNFMC